MKSDLQIQRGVVDRLAVAVPASVRTIAVTVQKAVVTLNGHVYSDAERLQAEEAVQSVVGVQALVIEIDVIRPDTITRPDGEILLAVRGVLQWQSSVPLHEISVQVRHGWVSLGGEVDGFYPRQKVVDAVRRLVGVRGIHDQVALKSRAASGAVLQSILNSLQRRTEVDARAVAVAVEGAEVTLTGSVQNWREGELVRQCAWSAAGVRQVYDMLEIHS